MRKLLHLVGLVAFAATLTACGSRRQPDDSAPSNDTPARAAAPSPDPLPWVTVGDVRIRVTRATVGKLPMTKKEKGGEPVPFQSEDTLLAVHIQVENLSPTKKIDVGMWGFDFKHPAIVTDTHGNKYNYKQQPLVNIATLTSFSIAGDEHESALYPGKSAKHVLPFEPPVTAATDLTVRLPASVLKQEGVFEIPIPAVFWKK